MAKRKTRKQRPTDPAEIARRLAEIRRNPALWGPNEDALHLPANADVSDEAETRTKVRRVQRFDVFGQFQSRKELEPHAVAAVRRLQDDIAILHRTAGTSGASVHAPNTTTTQAFAHARILAGQRIADAESMTGAHSWRILMALCEKPSVTGEQVNWRATVQRVTGEHNHMAQAALVKAAALNLAGAYQAIDQGERRRA